MGRMIAIIVGASIFVAIAYLLLRPAPPESPSEESSPPRAAPAPRAERTPPAPLREATPTARETPDAAGTEAAIDLPPLASSDSFVRERIASLPIPKDWVAQDHLVRRLAVVLDNATRGDIPLRQVQFLKPDAPFRVVERDGRLYGHPDNPRRFDGYLDRLESIEPSRLARLLRVLEPLIDEAFAELGSSDRGVRSLREAIDRVLDMRPLPEEPELIQPKILYEYADEDLEAMAPIEKQLVRLGPTNLRRLQAYLRELRSELGR